MKLPSTITVADLFCGAGGTSTGAIQAIHGLGCRADLTAINHWPTAVKTHSLNHPGARHICATIDQLNPRELFAGRKLDLLWASPECTHHSRARGGKPKNDQSRATAHCVTRWAEALQPDIIGVENVPEFDEWGPLGSNGKPIASRKGETFQAWVNMIRSLGYRVEWRTLCAADYGDPTTRQRLIILAVRGRRRIIWPEPTHAANPQDDLFSCRKRWRAAQEIIDWSIPTPSLSQRRRPLAPRTLQRIEEGLRRYGGQPFVVAMEHGGRTVSATAPLPTVTTARGGAMGVAFLIPVGYGERPEQTPRTHSLEKPAPTIVGTNKLALVVEYYGNGKARPVTEPLPTATTKARFGLVEAAGDHIGFRMLQPHELAAAQGFPDTYQFTGTKAEAIKQIGNAVPCGLSRAVVAAILSQDSHILHRTTAQ